MTKIELLDNHTTIEVDKCIYTTITFTEGTSSTELTLSKANFEDLGNKMFPNGMMPDDFHAKLDMLNALIEDIGPILDKEQPDWCLGKVTYDRDSDNAYCGMEEI